MCGGVCGVRWAQHQESFYAILCDLQEEAEATLTEGDADRQRERSYDSAKEVDRGLHDVELTLKGLVEDFNSQLVQRRTTQEQKVTRRPCSLQPLAQAI